MNYHHAYHAGNHADVLKHMVLLAVLDALKAKDSPFFVLDTHAGQGQYSLESTQSQKTGEANNGIVRLKNWRKQQRAVEPALKRYLDAITPHQIGNSYPGSPLLIAESLRENDRLAACELQPEPAALLKSLFNNEKRVGIHQRDGYGAMKALLPPPEKRGFVLIDPPYEAQLAEFDAILEALTTALTRWPTGIFALWYPIKQRRALHPFIRRAQRLNAKNIWTAELMIHDDESPLRLNGSGMMLINPPWKLDAAIAPALAQLAAGMAEKGAANSRIKWLKKENETL